MKRQLVPWRVLATLGFLIFALEAQAAGQSENGSVTFHVQVGDEHVMKATEINWFFPSNLTVNVGDTIVFTQATREPHTVTFNAPNPLPEVMTVQPDHSMAENGVVYFPSPMPQGPPAAPGTPVHLAVDFDGKGYVNSGFLEMPGDTYTVTFAKAGSFPYICLLHTGTMKGTITVNALGTARTMTDAQYAQQAGEQMAKLEATADQDLSAVAPPSPTTNADGTKTYAVYAGAGDMMNGIDFSRFFGGENLTVNVGDSVDWVMSQDMPGMPHTVTFLSGGSEPPMVTPKLQAGGPPLLLVNPQIAMPSPLGQAPAVYDGTGYFNSGLMVAKTPTPQDWKVTFTKPGKYHYFCVLHDEMGMQGDITVASQGGM